MGLFARQQIGVPACLFVRWGLPDPAWPPVVVWLAPGLAIYFVYGYRNSAPRRGTRSLVTEETS